MRRYSPCHTGQGHQLISVSLQQYEVIMLDALKSFEPTIYEDIRIRTPTVKPLASLSNTSILEDFKGSTDLKTYLGSHKSSLDFAFGRSLGFALGRWLSAFHQWANDPNNADATSLRGQLAGNLPMKQLKTDINIGRLVQSFPEFPGLPWESTEVYRKIEEDVRQMLWDQGDQLVHGDFWTGKYASLISFSSTYYTPLFKSPG
ncbi:hypothetical protein UCRPC4_g01981 [Phaeomoniella chlamydospora]|uniref:Uncharacterized protein n=1 Tax=Phaeomoniella chlamydospora TaxID=158046 RepID=A0A0G2H989_PHACM|nr:hypothetical protein UCRPC4_g01981 [Phaeomoniella chlamydospora]